MKKSIFLALQFFLLGGFLSLWAQPQTERILEYHSDIRVLKDGTMKVKEIIKVRSQGIDIRRGIFRSFPVKYRDRLGNNVVVRFQVDQITRDGVEEPYHIKKQDRYINLYIGSADSYLTPGDYTYELTYSTNRQLGFFEEYDELYWNVIGTGWSFPIDAGSARIVLPEQAEILQFDGWSGPEGSTACDCEMTQQGASQLNITLTKPLGAYEGLTVALAWPKGVVSAPTLQDRISYFLRDNTAALFGLIGLIMVFLYYLYSWSQVGKDPQKGTILPLFESPENLSAGAARYVMKMGFDNTAFVSSIVSMAVKGVVKISEQKKDYTLHKISEDLNALSSGEKLIVAKLFKNGQNSIKLTNKKHETIRAAINAHKASLKTEFQRKYFNLNRKWLIPGVILTILTLAIMVITSELDRGGDNLGILIWLAVWTVGCTVLISHTFTAWKNAASSGWAQKGSAIFMTIFSFPFLAAEVTALILVGGQIPMMVVAITVLLLVMNILFYFWMEAPTIFGRQVMDKIEGFRMYLSTAEKHRLNMMHAPEKTPQLFERLLPYAIALGVANKWAKQFEETLKAAQSVSGEQVPYHPMWYSGTSDWTDIGASKLTSNLSSSFSSAVASSSTPPGSGSGSGGGFSGGGGSSGGGGGGGGGGGW